MAYLYGDENNNVLTGTDEYDSLYGNGGNDTISGLGDNDRLYGGDGDDSLDGGEGDDYLYPGIGANVVDGGNGNDYLSLNDYYYTTESITLNYTTATNGTVRGGALNGTTFQNVEGISITTSEGNDVINISAANSYYDGNSIYTNGGNDSITTGIGSDYVDAGDGNDTINTADGNDTIYGEYGSDTINAGAGDDTIYGDYYYYSYQLPSADVDTINAGDGNDYISVNATHSNTVDGGAGTDSLNISAYGSDTPLKVTFTSATKPGTFNGGSFRNIENLTVNGSNDDDIVDVRAAGANSSSYYAFRFYGYGGNDKFTGSSFADSASGGSGNDNLSGGGGDDYLYGDSGTDTLNGGSGTDNLYGYSEADKLIGGAGSDYLDGGTEADTLTGVDTATAIVCPGSGEIDRLDGGAAKDTFVLGDGSRVYYNDGDNSALGQNDFALIGDFSSTQKDIIRLRGTSSDYVIEENTSASGYYGTGIYLKTAGVNELVAIVQGSNSAANVSAGLSFIAPTTV